MAIKTLEEAVRAAIAEHPTGVVTVKAVAEQMGDIHPLPDEILAFLETNENRIRRQVGAPVWETTVAVVDLDDE
jgi:hypothetical protein